MDLFYADRVKETSTTTGTGSYSLAGAEANFASFVGAGAAGEKVLYAAIDNAGAGYECAIGTVTDGAPDTLSRDYVVASSNSGNAVSWSDGTRTIVLASGAFNMAALFATLGDGDPNGFTNARTEWHFAYTEGTRTLELSPIGASAEVWSNGRRFTKTAAINVVHPDTEGMHYFYVDDTGALLSTMTFSTDLILKYAIAALGYWDATNNKIVPRMAYEMHGTKLGSTEHLRQHLTIGSIYNKASPGLAPTVTLGDGSNNTHIQVSGTAGSMFDEDVQHTAAAENAGDNKIKLYRSGASGDWRFAEADSAIIRTGGSGRAVYNQYTGGAWQDTEMTEGYFFHVYRYLHNSQTDDTDPVIIYVQGQTQYASSEEAQVAAQTRPDLGVLPSYEMLLLQTFLVQTSSSYTNSYKSRIFATHTGAGYYDWRLAIPVAASGGVTSVNGATGAVTVEVAGAAASAVSAHEGAADPHTQYVQSSEIGTAVQAYDADIATVAASQAEMEAGTEAALRSMSPLRVAQAIAALAGGGSAAPEYWMKQTTARTLTSSTALQKLFDKTTNGALSIPTGVYEFQAHVYMTGMSATSGNALFNILGAGTAVLADIGYQVVGVDNTTPTNAASKTGSAAITAATPASMLTAGTGTGLVASILGSFEVTTTGTLIPSVQLVTAAAATVHDTTFIRIKKLGATGATYDTSGLWS